MNLYVDIGNSRIKWARGGPDGLQPQDVLAPAQTPQWPQLLPLDGVDRLVVASVAECGRLAVVRARAAALDLPVHVARTERQVGDVVNAYPQPRMHGVDRWMACLAAYARGPGSSVLIADAGTAMTLDWVGADGRHGGGLISVGLGAMRSTLRDNTQLRPDEGKLQRNWLATDTDTAIAAGTLRSTVALLDNAVAALKPERLLLTGGDAEIIAPYLAHQWIQAPQLVLEGLAWYAGHSRQEPDASWGAGQMTQDKSK